MERMVVCFGGCTLNTISVKVNRLARRRYSITIDDETYEVDNIQDLLYAFESLLRKILPVYYEDICWRKDSISFKGYTLTEIQFRHISEYNNSMEILQDILKNTGKAVAEISKILKDIESDIAEAEIIVYR